MAFEIDARMQPELMGIAWMIGHWEGTGHCHQPSGEDLECALTLDCAENGGNYLHCLMQWFTTDDQGRPLKSLGMETGFWRPQLNGDVEVVIAQPQGFAEIYVGAIEGAKIEMRTDLVARTQTADIPVTGGHRLYGNVESDLLLAIDRGTSEDPIQPFLWARLTRA